MQHAVQSLEINEVVPFSAIRVDALLTDTKRKILYRLHNTGVITIVKQGFFKREKPLKEWTNKIDYKVEKLHITLDAMIEG